jgi:hypothetical protein
VCSSAKYFVGQHVSQTQRDSHWLIITTTHHLQILQHSTTAYQIVTSLDRTTSCVWRTHLWTWKYSPSWERERERKRNCQLVILQTANLVHCKILSRGQQVATSIMHNRGMLRGVQFSKVLCMLVSTGVSLTRFALTYHHNYTTSIDPTNTIMWLSMTW